jgi:hypothetical protein
MSLLSAVSLDLRDGKSLQAQFGQRSADLLELERFDDGSDEFHLSTPFRSLLVVAFTTRA